MTIDDLNAANLNPAALDRVRPTEAAEPRYTLGAAEREAAGDRVLLSDLSVLLNVVAGSGREGRIAALTAQFEAGRYEPDLGVVAHALIAEAELRGAGLEES